MRAARLRLSPQAVKSLSARALDFLRRDPAWTKASVVLAYCPTGNELDVSPLIAEAWEKGVRLLLPRCRPGEPGEMDLACAACAGDLAPGFKGILEPDPDRCPAEEDPAPDLVLAPGLAFDRRGFRLGFGGGYYDRLLASPRCAGARAVGMAYAFQVVDRLADEPWDQPVHALCTDKELLWIRR